MDLSARVTDLVTSPKARWALAWLACPTSLDPSPRDFQDAATARLRATRLHALRTNPEGLLAEIHTRVEDWRYQESAHTAVAALGPPDGYRRIATALATSPAAAWWWEPLRRDTQVWICHKPIERGAGLPFITRYAHHWDITSLDEAITTSTWLPRLPATTLLADQTRPPWMRPDPATLSAWRIPIKPDARVAEIHSPADWLTLAERYPSHRTNLCQAPQLEKVWPFKALPRSVDWKLLSDDYEGLHLSVAGWLTATSQMLSLTDHTGYTFCEGWPTEATVWFRPVFTGEFERLQPRELPHRLEYGYGRPAAGSYHDLTRQPRASRWRDLLRWHARQVDDAGDRDT